MKRLTSWLLPYQMEFHVSRQSRERYQFDEAPFTTSGNVIFADFLAARRWAQQMNAVRDLAAHPEQAVRAGQINAMGLIDEILHQVIEDYRQKRNPGVMAEALEWLETNLSQAEVEVVLRQFTQEFPPLAVYRRQLSVDEYLAGDSRRADGSLVPNRQIALEELLMLWLENENPAFQPFSELFDDSNLERPRIYPRLMRSLTEFFDAQPKYGPENQSLIEVLRAPARAHPDSLFAQLEFIRRRWGGMFSFILARLLTSLDMIREEEKPVFGLGGGGPAVVYEFKGADYLYEPERFSPDLDWMPRLVLLAKNTYVWLDQLSRKYQRSITHLDQVPDDELEMLARWGFTGLWLIGLWERSPASQKIKQLRGNEEAVASAYSLFYYDIAADLGGDEAYRNLRDRAWRYGIRLASDMVPNHMGIDSRWVIEHPDWFVQLPYSPFPSYSFNGVNLSWDERVGLYLEDHYFNNTDAAVVFKRVDNWSGESRYIYHGNDGTSMPWNDTAQLNYLIPEVREAVIQTILHVARKFPIIRFDAAMTLAKRHYHRLWYPEPGSGGDIASRAEHGLTQAQFDEVFPEEFWRMVVDRVAQEAPDTLLLAEAFWLMEGYFVRTLGMHRVYNSAFMNMMRDEKNQEYRLVIKNTLEFDTEILKRYVNFMNNPDERTAVDQFGKGDKYFGICVMMATLPGLPMFGHGQVEGFTEKYGMEFRYPKWHEDPDQALVERHQREVFPLLRRRYLFGEAQHFLLYDLFTPEGFVNEDVYAYSNGAGSERALVVYHNRFAEARGWIHDSAAFAVKTGEGDEKMLERRSLGQGLGLRDDPSYFVIYREHISGLEYIRSCQELIQQGLYVELAAYTCRVFLDFRQVQDDVEHNYAKLAARLGGAGVPSIDNALRELALEPLLNPFRELVNPGMFTWLIQNRAEADSFNPVNLNLALEETERKYLAILESAQALLGQDQRLDAEGAEAEAPAALALEVRQQMQALLSLSTLKKDLAKYPAEYRQALNYLFNGPPGGDPPDEKALKSGLPEVWGMLFGSLITVPLGRLAGEQDSAERSRVWIDEWLLGRQLVTTLKELKVEAGAAARSLPLLRLLVGQAGWAGADEPSLVASQLIQGWAREDDAKRYLQVNLHEGVQWFNKECFDELVWWSYAAEIITQRLSQEDDAPVAVEEAGETGPAPVKPPELKLAEVIGSAYAVVQLLLNAEHRSGYRLDKLEII
jgi:glycosidase